MLVLTSFMKKRLDLTSEEEDLMVRVELICSYGSEIVYFPPNLGLTCVPYIFLPGFHDVTPIKSHMNCVSARRVILRITQSFDV